MSIDCEFSPYLDQVYEDIKKNLLESGKLFEDDRFPPTDASLASFKEIPKGVHWKRAKELSKDAKFIIHNGLDNANDLAQGSLNDCWFLAAVATIARIPEFFSEVVPHDQSFDDGQYCGIFHFRFWRYGEWIDIVVDDYLPVDSDGNLLYCKSRENENEYWCALLEKAYAKLNTSYEFLHFGNTADAMTDMTGGIQEMFCLRTVSNDKKGKKTENDPNALWRFLKKALMMNSICSCCITLDVPGRDSESHGLFEKHAYSVTKVADISINDNSYDNLKSATSSVYDSKNARLVRVRNPHGKFEWNGKFSDESDEWKNIGEEERKRIGLVSEDDGEFWMTFEDFLFHYDLLQLVHLNINACFKQIIKEKNKERDWIFNYYRGSWVSGESSGGADPEKKSFWTNPQYEITVTGDKAATLIVCLMQIGSRENRHKTKGESAEKYIIFYLCKVKNKSVKNVDNEDGKPLYRDEDLKLIGMSALQDFRESMERFRVNEGTYVIIPCLENEGDESEFLLRLYLDTSEEIE